jgi:hypothetical protein
MKAPRILPSQEYLRECFDYDPQTGALRWRVRPRGHFSNDHIEASWNTRRAGTIAGALSDGYRLVWINSEAFKAHRVIWKLVAGEEPASQIDHLNNDRSTNSPKNLREASNQQNQFNRRVRSDNPFKLKGVARQKGRRKVYAKIRIDGHQVWLGSFKTPGEAHAAYCQAAQKYHGKFWNPG